MGKQWRRSAACPSVGVVGEGSVAVNKIVVDGGERERGVFEFALHVMQRLFQERKEQQTSLGRYYGISSW